LGISPTPGTSSFSSLVKPTILPLFVGRIYKEHEFNRIL